MTLTVNKEEMTILGIPFDTPEEFKGAWYALSSNLIEGYEPCVEDVLRLKNYVVSRRGAERRA